MSVTTTAMHEKENNKSLISGTIKGSLFAVAVSLIGILIFAFVIKLTSVSDGLISPVNQAIKGMSVLMGCFYAFKQTKSNGLIKGILIGVIYTILSFMIFSLLNGQINLTKTLFNDTLFGAIIGAISGVIAINFKD